MLVEGSGEVMEDVLVDNGLLNAGLDSWVEIAIIITGGGGGGAIDSVEGG